MNDLFIKGLSLLSPTTLPVMSVIALPPVMILALIVMNPANIGPVEVVPVIISPPVCVSLRAAVVITSVIIPADSKTR
jgi:hypothetical protein